MKKIMLSIFVIIVIAYSASMMKEAKAVNNSINNHYASIEMYAE